MLPPRLLVLTAALCFLGAAASAQIRLAAPFQDHMVLQRDVPLNVFGSAPARAEVAVRVAGHRAETTADAEGGFLVTVPALRAGGPYSLEAHCGDARARIDDVLVGEVWIASGQSNMEWPAGRFPDQQDAIAASADDGLRLLLVKRRTATAALDTLDGTWRPASPAVVKDFSNVAWCYGRELRQHVGVPVGVIAASWGGTRAEAWTRRAALEHDPALMPILEHWDALDASYPERRAAHEAELAAWRARQAKGEDAGEAPRPPVAPDDRHHPATLFDGMIAPLAPLSVRGFIWYQGESNSTRGWQYRHLFPALIRDWRAAFGQGDLPFYFVQLANFQWRFGDGTQWADLRESQSMTLRSVPNTGMATAVDIGDPENIHPTHKDELARRLALWARAHCYGQAVVPSGPLYSHCRIEGDRVRLFFDHVAGGLVAEPPGLRGFRIAPAGGAFVDAVATIDGDSVVVHAPGLDHPAAVRYGWADDPELSLHNDRGLPAVPFRTDARPLPTQGALTP